MLVESPGKFLSANLVIQRYPIFVKYVRCAKFSKTWKLKKKIHMDSEKSMNLFEIQTRIGHLIIYGTIFCFAICELPFGINIMKKICFWYI